MPRQKKAVESALIAKGFQQRQGDHRYFVYVTQAGKRTTAKTKTSHSKKMKDLGDSLLGQMARQCYRTKVAPTSAIQGNVGSVANQGSQVNVAGEVAGEQILKDGGRRMEDGGRTCEKG